jgi:hypothetical protein
MFCVQIYKESARKGLNFKAILLMGQRKSLVGPQAARGPYVVEVCSVAISIMYRSAM